METKKQNSGCGCSLTSVAIVLIIISLFGDYLTLRCIGLGILFIGSIINLLLNSIAVNFLNKYSIFSINSEYNSKLFKAKTFSILAITFLWGGWLARSIMIIYNADSMFITIISWIFIVILPVILYIIGIVKKTKAHTEIVDETVGTMKNAYNRAYNMNQKEMQIVEDIDYEEVK